MTVVAHTLGAIRTPNIRKTTEFPLLTPTVCISTVCIDTATTD